MRAAPARVGHRVLLDTSAYFALSDANEIRSPAANAVQRKLLIQRWRLVTTNYIVAETHAFTFDHNFTQYGFFCKLQDGNQPGADEKTSQGTGAVT